MASEPARILQTEEPVTIKDPAVREMAALGLFHGLGVTERAQLAREIVLRTSALTVEQLTAYLQISPPTAYLLVKQPDFPAIKIGNRIVIGRAALEKWLSERKEVKLYGT